MQRESCAMSSVLSRREQEGTVQALFTIQENTRHTTRTIAPRDRSRTVSIRSRYLHNRCKAACDARDFELI